MPYPLPTLLVLCMFAFVSRSADAADFYTWTDEQGNVHISDSLSAVPPDKRQQAEHKRFEEGTAPAENTTETNASQIQPAAPSSEPAKRQLKKYIVPYIAYEGSAKRIIVSARLNNSVTARLAIDTGAPDTIITTPLAAKLGLYDSEHAMLQIQASGIGGTAPAVRTIIDTIEVGGAQISFVPTTITDKLSDEFEGLLGMDFVSNYEVAIDTKRRVVIFEELQPNPENPGGRDKEWWTSMFREFASYRSQWKEYSDRLDKKIRGSLMSLSEDKERKAYADAQYREADKLFDKLNEYARQNAVPVHWKQF